VPILASPAQRPVTSDDRTSTAAAADQELDRPRDPAAL